MNCRIYMPEVWPLQSLCQGEEGWNNYSPSFFDSNRNSQLTHEPNSASSTRHFRTPVSRRAHLRRDGCGQVLKIHPHTTTFPGCLEVNHYRTSAFIQYVCWRTRQTTVGSGSLRSFLLLLPVASHLRPILPHSEFFPLPLVSACTFLYWNRLF